MVENESDLTKATRWIHRRAVTWTQDSQSHVQHLYLLGSIALVISLNLTSLFQVRESCALMKIFQSRNIEVYR